MPDHLGAVLLRRVQRHRPPAAAHVEQAHPGLQAELASDEIVLRGLRLLERAAVGSVQ